MPRCPLREGFKPPPRQTGLRLSQQQRVDLVDALAPHDLTRPLLQSIEDYLYSYRGKRESAKRGEPNLVAWLKRVRRAAALAEDLRERLPLFTREDDDLIALLEQRAAAWKQFAAKIPPTKNHRAANSEISWTCLFVVEALDAAHIPLTLGRNTVVVEVLRLVRRWADALDDRSPRQRHNSYEFSRVIVESHVRNTRQRLRSSK